MELLSGIDREISQGVQTRASGLCRNRLLTATSTLQQQGGNVWEFPEQAWVADRLGGVTLSLVPDR